MEAWHVREAREADAPQVAARMRAFDGADRDAEGMAPRMRACLPAETIPLAGAREAVGLCALHGRPWLSADHPYAAITELYVAPRSGRRGAATALVRRAEALARARGARDLVLLTGFATMAPAPSTAPRALRTTGSRCTGGRSEGIPADAPHHPERPRKKLMIRTART